MPPRPRLPSLLLAALLLPLSRSEQQPLGLGAPQTVPVAAPFATPFLLAFPAAPSLPASTRVLVTLAQAAPAPPDLLLSVSLNAPPPAPDFSGPGCTRWLPCLPPRSDAAALTRHHSHAAVLLTDVAPRDVVHVRVESLDRGRSLAGQPLTPALDATLRIGRDAARERPLCGGLADDGEPCAASGECEPAADVAALGTCRCDQGRAGRFCQHQVEQAPQSVARPSPVPGAPLPLADAADVGVGERGEFLRWVVGQGGGRVVMRARVIKGSVVDPEGDVVEVGGGGGGTGVVATRGEEQHVARLQVNKRGDGERDTYEYLVVAEGEQRQEWVVWFGGNVTVAGGDARYSVRVRRCGADGLPDCPFEEDDDGGFPAGAIIGICVVAGVLVLAVVIGLCCMWRRRSGRKWGSTAGSGAGAWDHVQIHGQGVGRRASRNRPDMDRMEMEEYRRKKEERLRAAAEVSIDVGDGEGEGEGEDSTSASASPGSDKRSGSEHTSPRWSPPSPRRSNYNYNRTGGEGPSRY